MKSKRCSKCKIVKCLDAYYRCSNARNGRKSACKDCMQADKRGRAKRKQYVSAVLPDDLSEAVKDKMQDYYEKVFDRASERGLSIHCEEDTRRIDAACKDIEKPNVKAMIEKYFETAERGGRAKERMDKAAPGVVVKTDLAGRYAGAENDTDYCADDGAPLPAGMGMEGEYDCA